MPMEINKLFLKNLLQNKNQNRKIYTFIVEVYSSEIEKASVPIFKLWIEKELEIDSGMINYNSLRSAISKRKKAKKIKSNIIKSDSDCSNPFTEISHASKKSSLEKL